MAVALLCRDLQPDNARNAPAAPDFLLVYMGAPAPNSSGAAGGRARMPL